ncbi:hypothetical protein PssiTeo3_52750 [Pseudomonas sichuanensis]|nr:hypothetical protein [Pseudomonas sichuanensis]
MEHAVVGDDLRLTGGAEEHRRFIAGLVHVLHDPRLINHLLLKVGSQLAPQATQQRQQRVVAKQAGDLVDQQVGQQGVLPREQLAGLLGELVQLLWPAPGGPGGTALYQAVALQRRQVLAHRGTGDRQRLGQVIDAHARRLMQQRIEQVTLGTAQSFQHWRRLLFRTFRGTA